MVMVNIREYLNPSLLNRVNELIAFQQLTDSFAIWLSKNGYFTKPKIVEIFTLINQSPHENEPVLTLSKFFGWSNFSNKHLIRSVASGKIFGVELWLRHDILNTNTKC